jgi:hypothetical protein
VVRIRLVGASDLVPAFSSTYPLSPDPDCHKSATVQSLLIIVAFRTQEETDMTIKAKEPIILISSKRAAELIGVKPQTLRLWRYAGKGPRYIRLGENRYCPNARWR